MKNDYKWQLSMVMLNIIKLPEGIFQHVDWGFNQEEVRNLHEICIDQPSLDAEGITGVHVEHHLKRKER